MAVCGELLQRLQRACFAIECSLVLRERIFRAVSGRSGSGSLQCLRDAADCSKAGLWRGAGRPRVFLLEGRELIRGKTNQLCKNAMHRWNGASACESLGQSIISVAVTMTEAPSDSYLYI